MIDNREWYELEGRAKYIRLLFDKYLPIVLGLIILVGLYLLIAQLPEFIHLVAPVKLPDFYSWGT